MLLIGSSVFGQNTVSFTFTGTNVSSLSTAAAPGFMPKPSGGTIRVAAGSSGTPIYKLTRSSGNTTFKYQASSASTVGKFSAYGIPSASSVASLFYTINFNDSTSTNVNWLYGIGNTASSSNVINNGSGIPKSGTTSSPELFGVVRWAISNNDATRKLVFSYRNKATSTSTVSFTTISSSFFQKGVDYNMEFYCNNTSNSQTYTRSAVVYTVAPRSYHIWANSTRLSVSSNYDFPANELASNTVINATVLTSDQSQTSGVGDNSAAVNLKDIRMEFPTVSGSGLMSFAKNDGLRSFSPKDLNSSLQNIIKVYKNNGELWTSLNLLEKGNVKITIVNVLGSVLGKLDIQGEKGNNNFAIPVSIPSSGVYIASFKLNNEVKNIKFLY